MFCSSEMESTVKIAPPGRFATCAKHFAFHAKPSARQSFDLRLPEAMRKGHMLRVRDVTTPEEQRDASGATPVVQMIGSTRIELPREVAQTTTLTVSKTTVSFMFHFIIRTPY